MKRRKVGSIVYVLDDHRVLIALNSAKVEAEARSSVLELVETIGVSFRATQNAISLTVSPNIQMILLSFIPGGEFCRIFNSELQLTPILLQWERSLIWPWGASTSLAQSQKSQILRAWRRR
jgi:hypothetical protein